MNQKLFEKKYIIVTAIAAIGAMLPFLINLWFSPQEGPAVITPLVAWINNTFSGSQLSINSIYTGLMIIAGGIFYSALFFSAKKYSFKSFVFPVAVSLIINFGYQIFDFLDTLKEYEAISGEAVPLSFWGILILALVINGGFFFLIYPLVKICGKFIKHNVLSLSLAGLIYVLAKTLAVTAAAVITQNVIENSALQFWSYAGEMLLSLLPDVALGIVIYFLADLPTKNKDAASDPDKNEIEYDTETL